MRPWRSRKYLNTANGQPCAFCGVSDGTICARHIRLAGFGGTGQKPPDFMVVDGCAACDRKYGHMNFDDDARDVLRAFCLTLQRRFEQGVLGC